MNRDYAAFLAMAAMVPAAACDKNTSDAKTTETAAVENAVSDTEKTADFHQYSTGGLRLDCTLGFEKLTADAIAMEGMEMATETDEQIAYMTPDGVSFTMTKEAHYAHPMILRRDIIIGDGEKVANGVDEVRIDMAACGYGAKEASDQVMERFALLNEQFILQQKIRIVDD